MKKRLLLTMLLAGCFLNVSAMLQQTQQLYDSYGRPVVTLLDYHSLWTFCDDLSIWRINCDNARGVYLSDNKKLKSKIFPMLAQDFSSVEASLLAAFVNREMGFVVRTLQRDNAPLFVVGKNGKMFADVLKGYLVDQCFCGEGDNPDDKALVSLLEASGIDFMMEDSRPVVASILPPLYHHIADDYVSGFVSQNEYNNLLQWYFLLQNAYQQSSLQLQFAFNINSTLRTTPSIQYPYSVYLDFYGLLDDNLVKAFCKRDIKTVLEMVEQDLDTLDVCGLSGRVFSDMIWCYLCDQKSLSSWSCYDDDLANLIGFEEEEAACECHDADTINPSDTPVTEGAESDTTESGDEGVV